MTEYKPEDYAKYRIEKAQSTIKEVEVLIENKFWNSAINRMYYACFYAVTALLIKHKIHTSSHSGVRQKFGLHFVQTGKIEKNLAKHYTRIFEKRHKGDYNDFFDHDEETVMQLFPISKTFIQRLQELIKN